MTRLSKFALMIIGSLLLAGNPSRAQQAVVPYYQSTTSATGVVGNIPVSVANPLPVTATTATIGTLGAGTAVIGKVGIDQTTPGTTNAVINTASSQYPSGATAQTASATGTTAATSATLTATSGKTTYVCGFSIRANATAAATGNATVANTITGTLNFTQWTAPLATGIGTTEETFNPCVPASAVTTAIVITSAAPGSGGTVSVTAWGYQM